MNLSGAMNLGGAASADARPKRFYTDVAVVEADAGWTVTLDGRSVRTPARRALAVPSRALAVMIAAEWDAQGERVDIPAMHAVRLAHVALDRTPAARSEIGDQVRAYAETDLVCHLADTDAALRDAQDAAWAPLRAWAGEALGVALTATQGVIAVAQPTASLDAARDAALALDDFRLTGLAHAMGLLGSAVLAFAMARGRLDAAAAFAASRIDEAHQEARWGVDAEAAARAEALAHEVAVTAAVLRAMDAG